MQRFQSPPPGAFFIYCTYEYSRVFVILLLLPCYAIFLRNRWRGRPGVPRSAIHFRFHHTSLRRSTPHPPLRKNPPPSSTLQSDSSSHFLHSASCHTLLLSLFVVSCSCFLLFYGIPSSLCMTFPFPKYAVPFSLLVVGPCLYLIRFRRSHMPSFFRFHFPLSLSPRLAIVFCMVRLLLLCPPPLSHPHHHDSRLFFFQNVNYPICPCCCI